MAPRRLGRWSRRLRRAARVGFTVAALGGCGERATLPLHVGYGPHPALPPPRRTLVPTLTVAAARGWAADAAPAAAPGLRVAAFATGLAHPRWLLTLPNGDVLVAESDAPPRPADTPGLTGWIERMILRSAGADLPSANRITLLRDEAGNGVATFRSTFLEGLNAPFGIALVGRDLYIADTDALLRFPYETGETRITAPGVRVLDLPAGPINHHWTKNVIASPDGRRLYVTVGSNSDHGENGIAAEAGRAAIWEVDPTTGGHRLFATGLRNPNGLAWETLSGRLWTTVNERNELGSDLVPDYMTSVRDGGFYGWPYSYFGDHVDPRVRPPRPGLVASAIVPDYALGPHTASLGLAFGSPGVLPSRFWSGAFVGQHGSLNRAPLAGYEVVFVPFAGGRPSGPAADVLTGFVDAHGKARGRPVGVVTDRRGAVLVADDVGNCVWRLTAASDPAP